MQQNNSHTIKVDQLTVGLYIHLDLGWMDHPFSLSNFKIQDNEQIAKIKSIGLKTLRYDPKRSDCPPLPPAQDKQTEPTATQTPPHDDTKPKPVEADVAMLAKNARLRQLHQLIDESEKKFIEMSSTVKKLTLNIHSTPQNSLSQASAIVNELVDHVLTEGDIAIHALNGKRSTDAHYQHPLNVTVLALMIAKSIEMSKEDARLLGLGALFHDIGKSEITYKILLKKEPLTASEQANFEQHTLIGARIAKEIGLPVSISNIILHHHELSDGSGYPNRLQTHQIDPLVKIVALVNAYDNLCNPNHIALAKTPYEALAHLYAIMRHKYDEQLLKRLIKILGIYPPGSIVELSNGGYGIIISSNPNKPLRPYVLIFDPKMDRESPHIVDLRETPEININKCIPANQLPLEVAAYLQPRAKTSYFIELPTSQGAQDKH
jgi:putative nucleotidyltransferase with HDIG domain